MANSLVEVGRIESMAAPIPTVAAILIEAPPMSVVQPINPTVVTLEHMLATMARLESRLDEIKRWVTTVPPQTRPDPAPPNGMPHGWTRDTVIPCPLPRPEPEPPYGMLSNWQQSSAVPMVVTSPTISVTGLQLPYSCAGSFVHPHQAQPPRFTTAGPLESFPPRCTAMESPILCYRSTIHSFGEDVQQPRNPYRGPPPELNQPLCGQPPYSDTDSSYVPTRQDTTLTYGQPSYSSDVPQKNPFPRYHPGQPDYQPTLTQYQPSRSPSCGDRSGLYKPQGYPAYDQSFPPVEQGYQANETLDERCYGTGEGRGGSPEGQRVSVCEEIHPPCYPDLSEEAFLGDEEGDKDAEINGFFKMGKNREKTEKSPAEVDPLVGNVALEHEMVAKEDVELNQHEKPSLNKLMKLSLLILQQKFLDNKVLTLLKN